MSVKIIDSIEYCCCLKGIFVKHQLAELVKKVNTDVQNLEYEYQTDGNIVLDEFVIITFKSGYVRRVNITCDSYKSITEDVLKKI